MPYVRVWISKQEKEMLLGDMRRYAEWEAKLLGHKPGRWTLTGAARQCLVEGLADFHARRSEMDDDDDEVPPP